MTAADIMGEAATTLLDADAVRWTAPELFRYLNDGIRHIAAVKPNALTRTVTLSLVPGTLQRLPSGYGTLARITRNMVVGHDEPGGPIAGNAIRPIASRDQLDALIPAWQSDTTLFAARVVHVIYDLADRSVFYVAPGNDGTGKVEAVVQLQHDGLPAPITDTHLIASYTATVPLTDDYRNPLRDFVLYRAYAKDSAVPAAATRATAYMAAVTAALDAMGAAEQAITMGLT